jgi:ADP-ribose pyrophosphatase YjhB (NUDIX family)
MDITRCFKKVKFCGYCGNQYTVKEIQGRERLFCAACNLVWYENPIPAATALVLNSRNQLLLGKRGIDPQKGHWCLPGGFIEQQESMDQAALRELKEETGLDGRIICMVDCFYQESKFYGSLIIFGYLVEVRTGQPSARDDLDEVHYFDFEQLPPLAFESHKRLVARLKEQIIQLRS